MKNIAYISRGGLVKSPGLAACLSLLLLTIAWTSSGQVQNTGLQLTLTNNAVISTNSAWVSDAGSTTTNNGRIITSENWINNGTYAGASLGGFELKYATSKTFTLGGTQLARLRVNGTAGVSIPSLSITDSLTLVNGNVVLPVVTDVLTLQTGAKLIGGSTGSYVDGIVTRKGTGDLNFPLGKSSKFLPVIFYQVSGTSPALTVQVKAAPAFSPGLGVSILPSFPYAWSATTLSAADTATFVEIQDRKSVV